MLKNRHCRVHISCIFSTQSMSNRMGHYLPDNFIFGPWMLIPEFLCTFKKWVPDTLLSHSEPRRDTLTWRRCYRDALYCISETPDPCQLIPESWSSIPRRVIRAFEVSLQVLLPRTTFCQMICPEAYCNLLSFQDGVYKEAETFPCTTKRDKVWGFEVSFCPQLSSHVETRIQPT